MLNRVRDTLPRPARKLAGGMLRYTQRLRRWAIVLWQVRGASWRDQLKLLASAGAAPVTSLRGLSRWQDPVLLFDAFVRVGDLGTFHARQRSDDLWHLLPWRERSIHLALGEILRPGDLFVDAGANIGVYTILASRLVGPTGRVIAIEMMPDTAAILRQHIERNRCANVEVIERALSDRAGETVTATVDAGKYGQASIAHPASNQGTSRECEVLTTTLDEVCRDIDRIHLMKLDLEGAELPAIAGGRSALERTERVIYESHTANDELSQAFDGAGFKSSRTLGKDRLAERA